MADAVVGIAVERIGDLLKEAQFLSDVRDQVVEIQDELRRMKCFLKDADEKQVTDARVRNWIREVKILAERIEDLVEIYALKVASEKENEVKQVFLKRFVSSLSNCVALHKTGSEIARVRTKISNLTTSLQAYGITSINEGESSRANDAEQERWRRMSYPHLVEDDFVGMDDTVKKLVSLLVNEDQPRHLKPVSIWGMGGLGKTTVAKQVYNDNRIQRNFEGFAWICVTHVCETRRLLQDLLKQLLPGESREEIMSMGDQELVTQLYKVQQEKKCLVVLDDIWKMEDWECLRPAFPIEKKGVVGSKLLITTRIKEVAEIGRVHELECLNEDDGWELLRKKAIPKLEDEDDAEETMADAVVSIAVERIGDLLKEAQFLSDVRDQVVEIQDELRRMKCFLKDADEKQVTDARVRNWIREVKILAERIEDLVEIYALKVASEKENGVKQVFLKRFVSSLSKCVALHKTGSEIARVRTKISNLTTSLQAYGITSINEGESSRANDAEQERWRRMSYPHLVEDDFVGMDDTVKKLVSLLVNEDQPRHLKPVSIWGMGGLGKTTVAKQVYNDNHVQRNFEGFAWICVTQVCETRRLLQDLLKQLLPGESREEIMSMGDQELVTRLYKVQQEKKCLVVLDDIWKMEDWECLRPAFPIEKKGVVGSKLLITTRIKEVAEIGRVHELECLNEDDGWELLRKKAIPKLEDESDADVEVDADMEKVGREMVQKCEGLPLAIVVLGGILKIKYTINDWKVVDRAIFSYGSKGQGIEKRYVAVEQVLLLSYNNLPGHLKTCFLYLGDYLEDEVICAYDLYEKWIVGGVVSTNDQLKRETMLEIAERYLGDLAQRSMVQVELDDGMPWFRNSTKFKSCGLHDCMRDLCLSKAKEEEFSSVIAIKSRRNGLVSSSSANVQGDTNPRRLSIYYDEKNATLDLGQVLESIDWQLIRSLVLTPKSILIEYPLSIGNCSLLRYLELERIKFPNGKLPKSITRLVHLRCLKLQFCCLTELPTSIGNLCYLQILHLHLSFSRPIIIPNVLWKMRHLINLYLPLNMRVKKEQKLRLDGLSKLELLKGIYIRQFNVKDIVKLANLRFIDLQVDGNSTFEDVAWFIDYMNIDTSHHINGVNLHFKDCDFHPEEGQSVLQRVFQCSVCLSWSVSNSKLPKINFDETHCSYQLNNLTKIALQESEFDEDPFQILEKLPNLQILALTAIYFPGTEMVCSATGFSQLRKLCLQYLSNLEVWRMNKGSMPNLSELVISECSNLKMLPDQIRYLTSLKKLEIRHMPQEFRNRIGVVNGIPGEDFDKIRHVRYLIIR